MVLLLWTGPRHSGKTTSAATLAHQARQCGFRVAGLLAPAVYREGHLAGFEALDLRTGARSPLLVRRDEPGEVGPFHFVDEGRRLGYHALEAAATEAADVVIVDEFGPLELVSRGWRPAVDALVRAGGAALVLVVRQELAEKVRHIYAEVPSRLLDAAAPESVPAVLQIINHNS